ncbi:Ig domain-containing protein, partial [Bacillus sp. B1-b2]
MKEYVLYSFIQYSKILYTGGYDKTTMNKRKIFYTFLLLILGLTFYSHLDKVYANATPSVSYSTHVQDHGWLNYVNDGVPSGTTGQNKRVEALSVALKNAPYSGGISYKTHVENYSWLDSVSNGAISGKPGESKQVEAIQISLTGEMNNYYDVYYRVHSENYGWLDWAKNGQSAGTQGLSMRIEAIEIRLVGKGSAAPGSTSRPFVSESTELAITY